ncbi:hypothetical protein COLU111180_19430 [Cohnella lubricantis]|uniref:Extracellular solute-binding protein n=1 Tax=Cohnella lubricantis TaxID=2163172 RepID=A0A841THI7_9BACL|nr:hypothetical protein [Cohnella lubricantis]MBB6677921.1 hypothetical protein [Cohnella lubricantis]MBP2120326.1 putative aldouronate transport system substrate-binding protein [Cohnella lubricantis]
MKLKIGALLTLAGIVALTGCSSKSNESGNSSNTSAVPSESVQQGPVELTWFSDTNFWNPPSPWNTDPNSVEGTITEKTGLTFQFNIPASDAGTKLSLMLATSEKLPDIVTVTDGTLIKKLIDSGKIWNLDEFFKKYDPSSPLLTNFPEDLKKALTERDGGWYAYPSHINTTDARKMYPESSQIYADAAKYGSQMSIIVNEKLMKEAGISKSDLTTENGFLEALKKVKGMQVDGAPVIPLHLDGKGYAGINVGTVGHGGTLGVLEASFGAMPVDKDGNYRDIILAPETKHALDFLFTAAQESLFDLSQMTLDTSAIQANIKSGRVFAFIGNIANTGYDTPSPTATTWVSPGPILSNQNTKPVMGRSFKTGTGWMQTFVSKTADSPERIAKWFDLMTSEEGQFLAFYGIEGKDYELDQDGNVILTDQVIENQGNYSKTGVGAFWQFQNNAWHDHRTAAPTSPTGIMGLEVGSALGKGSEIYDTSALQMPSDFISAGSQMANNEQQIQTYLEAQVSKVILAKDEAQRDQYYNDMISKVKQMGLDEINEKINDQFHKQEQTFGTTLKGINS